MTESLQSLTGRIVYSPDFESDPIGHLARTQRALASVEGMPMGDAADRLRHLSAAVTLTLPYPISANRYWLSFYAPKLKRVCTGPTKEAKQYKAEVKARAIMAGVRRPIVGRVRVDFTLYPNRPQDWQKRMRKDGAAWDDTVMCLDLDNAQKVVLDSLKDVVFQDDAWVREIHARRAEPDEFGARLMVTVTALATENPQGALI